MQGGPFGFKNRAFRECNFGLQIGRALEVREKSFCEVREKSFCPRRFYQTVVSTKEPIPIPRLTQIVRVKRGLRSPYICK